MVATRALLRTLPLLLRGAGAEEGEGPCPELLYGIGLHGTGPMKAAPHAGSVEECCMSALTALGGTWHCDGFTYDNATGSCLLFRAPLRPHSAGAENNTSGSWISLGPLPPPLPPPGPPAPAVPFPAAKPTISPTPTFAKPPRPNIVLFFGDGATPCVSSLRPHPKFSCVVCWQISATAIWDASAIRPPTRQLSTLWPPRAPSSSSITLPHRFAPRRAAL
eukprot:COSAG02_NODE_11243_length_1762_cov_1.579675_2_plen_220_part_00